MGELAECQFCQDGVCVGCNGTGIHPMAGKLPPTERDYIPTGQKCSWCSGTGFCSIDPEHAEAAQK